VKPADTGAVVPFPRPTFLAVCGMIVGQTWVAAWDIRAAWLSLVFLFGGVALAFCFSKSRIPFGVFAAFMAIGMFAQSLINQGEADGRIQLQEMQEIPGPVLFVEGKVKGEPRFADTWVTFWIAEGAALSKAGRTAMSSTPIFVMARDENASREFWATIAPGSVIEMSGRVEPRSANPAHNEFGAWLESKGAVFSLRCNYINQSEPHELSRWQKARLFLRQQSINIEDIYRTQLSTKPAQVMTAMTLGRTSGLQPELRENFRRAGVMHLFAVSGLHTGLVALMIFASSSIIGLPIRMRTIVVIIGISIFIALTGFRTSALRAGFLIGIFLLRPHLSRDIDPLGAISSVALLLLLLDARFLWQIDFQLSFLCATTIVLVHPIAKSLGQLTRESVRKGWVGNRLAAVVELFWITFCIQIALLPISLLSFGEASVIAPFVNAFALPLSLPFLFLGLVTVFFYPTISIFSDAVAFALDIMLHGFIEIVSFVGSQSFATFGNTTSMTAVAGLLFVACLLAGRWIQLRPLFSRMDGTYSAITGCAAAGFILLVTSIVQKPANGITITFLDVGQGDAILIKDGKHEILIDTGPERGNALLRELHQLDIERLELLLLTHADTDHIGSASVLLEHSFVDQLVVGGTDSSSAAWMNLVSEVDYRDVPVVTVMRDAEIQLTDKIRFQVLHPSPEFVRGKADRNDASIVLLLEIDGVRFLLTGDAEKSAEEEMIEIYGSDFLDVDVLKAGHHGSNSSSTLPFLLVTSPQYTIFSCGRQNRYGHPHEEVLDRVSEVNSIVLRTDQQGTVKFSIQNGRMNIETEF